MSQSGPKRFFDWFHKDNDEENQYEEEIINILNEGSEQGAIQNQEAQLISNVFEFTDKDAKDIMTIRKKVVGVDKSLSLKEAVDFILEQNYSRFPLYDEDLDNVIGVLHLKDVMKAYIKEPDMTLEEIAKDAYFVHEAQDISDMFTQMQKTKQHMAIVVDEYGQTSGIVAMEDIIEVILGNILDEHDVEEREFVKLNRPGEYIIRGSMRLDRISDEIEELVFPDEDIDTLNGFIINQIGHLPQEKEKIELVYGDYQFRALEVRDNMIVLIKVIKMEPKSSEE
ncbi:MAG: hemolysin family protein [Lachnospiraceae bacterium]|nr:hemolysin family protein [Lachnospiraceae bacterium]